VTSTTPAAEELGSAPEAPRRALIAVVVVVLALAFVVVVRAAKDDGSVPGPSADGLWTALTGDAATGSGELTIADLSEAAPSSRGTTVAVWGSVEGVEAGPAFSGPEDGSEAVSADATDEDPMWIHLLVRPQKSVGGNVADVIRVEIMRPDRWGVSDLSALPADDLVAVLVPVTKVFEGQQALLAVYDNYPEPVYRVFAKSVFTEPRPESSELGGQNGEHGPYEGHPGEVFAPFLEGNEYDQLLAPVDAANNGQGVSSLARLWAWFVSTEQGRAPK
jgi:hypothetical protein